MNTQNGTLIGIGVELAVDPSGYAKVIKVYDESPAKEAGIQAVSYTHLDVYKRQGLCPRRCRP